MLNLSPKMYILTLTMTAESVAMGLQLLMHQHIEASVQGVQSLNCIGVHSPPSYPLGIVITRVDPNHEALDDKFFDVIKYENKNILEILLLVARDAPVEFRGTGSKKVLMDVEECGRFLSNSSARGSRRYR